MKKQHVGFLSYSRTDNEMMQRIKKSLDGAGLEMWTDTGLNAGEPSWKNAIKQALRDSQFLVVILSPDSEQSRYVNCEIQIAELLKLQVFPVLVRGDELSSIPFGLDVHQWIDLRPPEAPKSLNNLQKLDFYSQHYDKQIKKLIEDITTHIAETSAKVANTSIGSRSDSHKSLNQLMEEVLQQLELSSGDTTTSPQVAAHGGSVVHPRADKEKPTSSSGASAGRSNTTPATGPSATKSSTDTVPKVETLSPPAPTSTSKSADFPPPSTTTATTPAMPFEPPPKMSLEMFVKLCLVVINIATLLGLGFYWARDSFLGYGQLFVAVMLPLFGTILGVAFTSFELWLDRRASVPTLVGVTGLVLLTALAFTQPWWARLSVREPTPINDVNGGQPVLLQPGQFPVTLLAVSSDSESYLVECPAGVTKDQQCWVAIDDRIQRQGIESPLPIVISKKEQNATPTAQSILTMESANSTSTAVRQIAMLQTDSAEQADAAFITQTAAARGATSTTILLSITAEGYNTATREAGYVVLTQASADETRQAQIAANVRATLSTENMQTAQAAQATALLTETSNAVATATANAQASQSAAIVTGTANAQATALAQQTDSVATANAWATQTAAVITETANAQASATAQQSTIGAATDARATHAASSATAAFQTLEARTPLAENCAGDWQRVSSIEVGTFFICDSLVTDEEFLALATEGTLSSGEPFFSQARSPQAARHCELLGQNDSRFKYSLPTYEEWEEARSPQNTSELGGTGSHITVDSNYPEWLWTSENDQERQQFAAIIYDQVIGWQQETLPLILGDTQFLYFRCVAKLRDESGLS
ncbi:MAG: TIR domain-containing protein [Anaerolineae bacterium]|nr:TIR domain-containing protein [Anaerolineae bacterium]